MNLYPTRAAAHVAIAGAAVVGVGVALQEPAIAGWGGALLVAVAIARAVTLVQVARIRAAGFEMLWTGTQRMKRTFRGSTIEIEAEVRNRDTLAARFVKLRAVASPNLQVEIEPAMGEVHATGRLKVKVKVTTPRVGQHGVHGLALEVLGAPGMFEVPLTFANPYGVEVLPRPFSTYLMQPRGGRSHLLAPSGRPGRARGDGSELRELREHLPGDPFRRIAWKASARRGRLVVREFEREERDVVWVVLDASVELWAGPIGRAPLDLAIDEAAAIATRHLGRGDRVGLVILAQAQRATLQPDTGPSHGHKLAHALMLGAGTYDASRSDLDELDVAVRVLEHLRPLDAKGLGDVRRGDLDKLSGRAEAMRGRAPFPTVTPPEAKTIRERILRRYLAAYGIDSPAKSEPERKATLETLANTLRAIARGKPRPSLVHVIASVPDASAHQHIADAVRRLQRSRATVSWTSPQFEPGLRPPWPQPAPRYDDEAPPKPVFDEIALVAAEAVEIRTHTAQVKNEAALRKLGVRVVRLRPKRANAAIHV